MYTIAKFIIFSLLYLYSSLVYSQTSYTGNLVDTNWSNGYQVPSLTCWKGGDPNCSPGTPYIRPDGNINFSYNATELYQARSIADVLPNSGTGLIVTGFQFNWQSKNGNGWDNGALDTLQAYIQMYSKGGQWIEAQTYNLNFIHDWTDFSWSGNFTKERRGSDLGTILYGFYGRDNNYWMGPYGPEITNVSFSLRYQPDPCVVNPLHSTECPGFLAAINKPIPGLAEASASHSISSITQSNSLITAPIIASALNTVKLNAQKESTLVESTVQLSTQETTTNLSTVTTNLQVQLPQINKPIQRADSQARTDSAVEAISLDQMLASPQINQQLATTTTVSLPPTPVRTSTTNQTQDVDTTATVQVTLVKVPEITQVQVEQSQSTLPERPIQENSTMVMPAVIQPAMAAAVVPEPPQVEPPRPPQVENTIVDAPTNTIATALIDRTNPLNDMLNGQQQMAQSGPVFAGPAVKSNTADNDLAGGVSISQIARVPAGFDVYTNLAIREIAFYQPKEIYRGQRTVDNVRALRSLGQDARHQEMIDQQYRR
jgi:hypothetical protein